MRTHLYGLLDPRTQELRYVGKTVGPLKVRFNKHLYTSKKKDTHRACWFQSVLASGHMPIIELLETVEGDGAAAEIAMIGIARSLGCRLTNETKGGDGALGYRHTAEGIAKTAAASRGRPQSAAARKQRSEALRGRARPREVAARISAAQKGVPKSAEAKERMRAAAHRRHFFAALVRTASWR